MTETRKQKAQTAASGKIIDLMEALKASLAEPLCGAVAPLDDVEQALGLMSSRRCCFASHHEGPHSWQSAAAPAKASVKNSETGGSHAGG